MNEERDYLYLKGTEELGEVVDALREIKAKEIIIVVPRNMKSFLNSTNLDLLHSELSKLKKKIYLDSDDEKIISLARSHGFEIFLSEYGVNEVTRIVTDILPPQKTKPKIKKITSNKEYSSDTHKSSKPKRKGKLVIISILIIFIFSGYFIFNNYLASASLLIKLKTETHPVEENLILSSNVLKTDLEKLVIPGEYIEINKNHSIRQKTTGLKEGRSVASGKVKFINTDQKNSISIIPGTRIQTKDGKIYRTAERIYLEAGSEMEVNVFADQNNPNTQVTDLNTEFIIPGLKNTDWENKIQVKLIEPIIVAGDEVRFVSLDDINEGKLNLEKQLQEVVKQELKLKYPNYVFPEELGIFDVKFLNISHSVGQRADEVIITGSASLKTIGVKENILKEFLKDIISKQNLRKDLNFQIINLKINSIRMGNFDLKNKELLVSLSGDVEIKGELDTKKIISEVAGQDVANIQQIIEKYEQIEKAELSVWPFWLNKIPLDISKIKVLVK